MGIRLPGERIHVQRATRSATMRWSLGEYGWFDGNSEQRTHPVGQKRPNGFGLYDMHGNVWEWCWDWYGEGYYNSHPRTTRLAPRSSGPRPGDPRRRLDQRRRATPGRRAAYCASRATASAWASAWPEVKPQYKSGKSHSADPPLADAGGTAATTAKAHRRPTAVRASRQ